MNRSAAIRLSESSSPSSISHARDLFLLLIACLLCLGIVMVYSASMTSRPSDQEQIYLSRHLTYLMIALLSAGLIVHTKRSVIELLSPWLFWGSVLLLVGVLIPGIGHRVNGAQRWIRLGGLTIQPSELLKLTLPLYLAYRHQYCSALLQFSAPNASSAKASAVCEKETNRDELRWFNWLGFHPNMEQIQLIAAVLFSTGLVMMQPDLGTSVMLFVAASLFLFAIRWPMKLFLTMGTGCLSVAMLLMLIRPYQWKRITGFWAGLNDLDAAPYQVKQSLLAIGSGGFWGTGLGQGTQKLSYLPEAQTDFLLAVVGEELGLLGLMSVLLLWVGIYVCGLRLLMRLKQARPIDYVLGWTYLTMVLLQAVVNAGVVFAVLPPKGISHPLLSYGGSNLVVTLSMLALVYQLTTSEQTILSTEWKQDSSLEQAAA